MTVPEGGERTHIVMRPEIEYVLWEHRELLDRLARHERLEREPEAGDEHSVKEASTEDERP